MVLGEQRKISYADLVLFEHFGVLAEPTLFQPPRDVFRHLKVLPRTSV